MSLIAFASLAYAVAALVVTLAYVRREYMENDLGRCLGCSLYGFCSKLRLNRVLPPSRLVHKPSRSFVTKVSFTIIGGYVIVLSVVLLFLGPSLLIGELAPIIASVGLMGFFVRTLFALAK